MDTEKGSFFIGAVRASGEPVVYDGADLTTHGVIVGMTGSGKTGLGIGLIEEALMSGIPCLIIDPKGDMGNLMLSFPEFRAEDFQPWIDEAAAAKEGVSVEEKAASVAAVWKEGLEKTGIGPDRLRKLRDQSRDHDLYPGFDGGCGPQRARVTGRTRSRLDR